MNSIIYTSKITPFKHNNLFFQFGIAIGFSFEILIVFLFSAQGWVRIMSMNGKLLKNESD